MARPVDDEYEDRLRDRRSQALYDKADKVHKAATETTVQAKRTLETVRRIYEERSRNG